MQRWRGALWTLHMGWRSGTGHSETLFWATCAGAVKYARRAPHSVSLAVSVSVGGQRAGGASGHTDPTTSCRHKPVWLRSAGSCSKNLTLTVFFCLHDRYNSVSIKAPMHMATWFALYLTPRLLKRAFVLSSHDWCLDLNLQKCKWLYMKLQFGQYHRNIVGRL